VLVPEVWAVDNGFLTPTLKIKRNELEDAAAPQVETWYSSTGKVVWS